MARSTFTSDPRTIVTLDAFEVDRKLLGFPLASPTRRLLAILVDVVIIGVLTTLPGILLGIVAAALFLRIWGKSEKGDPLERAFKWAMGCFGAFVLFVTLIVVVALRTSVFRGVDDGTREGGTEKAASVSDAGSGDVLSGLGLGDLIRSGPALVRLRRPVEELGRAESAEEARAAAEEIARTLGGLGVERARIREVLEEIAGPSPEWGDERPVIDAALASVESAAPAVGGRVAGEAEPAPGEAEPAPGEAEPSGVPAFSREAEDSFAALQSRLAGLESQRAELRDELGESQRDLKRARDEADRGGFFSGLSRFVDNLGLGFGWGSLYMTIVMAWWKGQTVGKRIFNIRVLRLDGKPIGWFMAFERAGGYAAGFATGLLGFAQIWWDPNRQAIHDKIVGTVVIRDGEDRVPGPWTLDAGEDGR